MTLRKWFERALAMHSIEPDRRALLWALCLAGLVLLVLHAGRFFTPFWHYDDLWWLEMGRVMGAGGHLYLHAMDTKAPLFLYVFYWGDWLGAGQTALGVTLIILGFQLATTVVIYVLGRRILDHVGGLWASVLYIAGSFSIKCQISQSASPEQFALLPLALALYVGWPKCPAHVALKGRFWAGLMLGVAFGFRPQLAILLLPFGLASLWERSFAPRHVRACVLEVLALTAGFATFVAALGLLFYVKGNLALLWLYVFELQRAYVAEAAPAIGKIVGVFFSRVFSLLYSSPFVWSTALIGLWGACRQGSSRELRFLALWQAAAFLTVFPGFKLDHAYFGVLLLGNALLAAGVTRSFFSSAKVRSRRIALCVLVLPLIVFHCESWIFAAYWQGLMPYESTLDYRVKGLDQLARTGSAKPTSVAAIDKRDFLSGMVVYFNRPTHPDLSRTLRSLARPGDQLFVWGFAPELYQLTKLWPATRFYTTYHLTGQMRNAKQHFNLDAPAFRTIWKQAMGDLARSQPRFIVDCVAGSRLDTLDALSRYPQLSTFITEHYTLVARINLMALYELKSEFTQGPLLWSN
jgi:hypothetical protein